MMKVYENLLSYIYDAHVNKFCFKRFYDNHGKSHDDILYML